MALPDFMEFLDPLELPIRGKTYVIPPMSLETGLRLTAVAEGEEEAVKDFSANRGDVYRTALGSAYDEMVADSVLPAAIELAMQAAFVDFKMGRDAAEITWKAGGDPKAIESLTNQKIAELNAANNRATRRKAQKQSPGTAAASTTKRQASTSTMKTSRKNS